MLHRSLMIGWRGEIQKTRKDVILFRGDLFFTDFTLHLRRLSRDFEDHLPLENRDFSILNKWLAKVTDKYIFTRQMKTVTSQIIFSKKGLNLSFFFKYLCVCGWVGCRDLYFYIDRDLIVKQLLTASLAAILPMWTCCVLSVLFQIFHPSKWRTWFEFYPSYFRKIPVFDG